MARASVFQDLHREINTRKVKNATKWFRKQARSLQTSPSSLLQDAKMTTRPLPGRMYLFHYHPKYEATLPYWDRFPLVFFMPVKGKLFSGLNLHYLPMILRAKLMDELYDFAINMEATNRTSQLVISYQTLESAAASRLFKPTYKRYLTTHMRSRFMYISPQDWDIALMLPLARFQKASINKVHRDSRIAATG